MPYDLEDEEGWTALPTLSDSEEEVAANSIGPVHSEGSTYTYDLPEHCQSLAISFQPEKVTDTCSLIPLRRGLHHSSVLETLSLRAFRVSVSKYGHLRCHCLDTHSCKIYNREGTGRLQLVSYLLLALTPVV